MIFIVTNFGLYFSRMSLDPASVVSYFNGSDEEFRPARSFQSMLEVAHGHMATMALVLLLLTHLLLFAPFSRRAKVSFIVAAFVSGLLSEGGGWLVRYVHPSLAIVKVVGFVGLQGSLMFLLGSLAAFLLRARAYERDPAARSAESLGP